MYSLEYKLHALTLLTTWPIWAAFVMAAVSLTWVQRGAILRRLPLALGLPIVVVLIYAMVGRPGFEGWSIHIRTDLKENSPLLSVLEQHRIRTTNDPRDHVPAASLGDYLAASGDGSAELPVAAHVSYLDAERKGPLTADQYARWAQLTMTAEDVVNLPEPVSKAALLDRALALDPQHIQSRFLVLMGMSGQAALDSLRQLDAEISPVDSLSATIDEQILLLIVGEQPAIAPTLALSSTQMSKLSDSSDDDEPPFLKMVQRLEGRVFDRTGDFLAVTEGMGVSELALASYRLGRARLVLGDVAGAIDVLRHAASLLDQDDPLHFWIGMTAWNAGDVEWSLAQFEGFRRSLPEGSPEWRAMAMLIQSLSDPR